MNDVTMTSRAPVLELRRVHSYDYEPETAARSCFQTSYTKCLSFSILSSARPIHSFIFVRSCFQPFL